MLSHKALAGLTKPPEASAVIPFQAVLKAHGRLTLPSGTMATSIYC